MISIMSNSSINKNDSPDISENNGHVHIDVSLHSTTTGSNSTTFANNNNNNDNNNRMYINNSNSCFNSLESAQLKKLKKSRYSLNQQEQEIHQEVACSPSKPLTQSFKSSKPERTSPTLMSNFSSSSPSSPLLTSSNLINKSSHVKQDYDSNSNSNSPSFSSSNSNGSVTNLGDQRTMDAADTLVSLAHSASSTPTIESKSFADAMPQSSNLTLTTNGAGVAQKSIDINNNIEIVSIVFSLKSKRYNL